MNSDDLAPVAGGPAILRHFDAYQRSHAPLAFVIGVVKKFGDDRGSVLAALLAYYGFLAVFPLLLLATTILGFVMGRDTQARNAVLHSTLRDFPIIGDQLTRSVNPLRGSAAGLIVGLLGLVWGALGVAQAGQLAMAEVWNVPGPQRPNFVTRIVRGLGLLAIVGVGVIASTAGAAIVAFGSGSTATVAGLALSVALNVVLYALAFRVLTVRTVATRDVLPGAVIGGVGWSVLQVAGGFLVSHQLRHASTVYGFFASVLGLISWLYLGAQLAIYAAEINVVRARHLWPRNILQPPLTEADMRTLDDIAGENVRRPEQSVRSSWTYRHRG